MDREHPGNRESVKGINEIPAGSDNPVYYVQILASSVALPAKSAELKALKDVEYYRDGGFYKYAIGPEKNLNDAKKRLSRVRKSFPEAFIIKMVNGKRVDFIKP